MPWKLTVRTGPRVQRSQFEELDDALDALEARARELASGAPNRVIDLKLRRFEPAQQVAARVELSGPERRLASIRAGVDVRGDGSTEAYLGAIRRQILDRRPGETAYKALRRALADGNGE